MRVADYIAAYVTKLGVKSVFLLSGGGMMHLIDAVGRNEGLRYICNHHEQACGLGAEGYARQSGGLGVCYATSGPGATNTVTAVVECYQDSVPVLFLSGQSKLSQTIQGSKLFGLRQFGTFEADIISIVKPITKYAAFLDDPRAIRYHLEKACHLALSGRPGPVYVDVPVDLQGAPIDPDTLEGYTPEPVEEPAPADDVLDRLLQHMHAARAPLIVAGHGVRVADSVAPFKALIQALNVPTVTTQHAADLLAYAHPLYVGHPGVKGDRPGNLAVQNADFILTIGCSLHVLTTGYELDQFAPRAYKVQVDLDELVLAREQVGVDEKIRCSVQTFVKALGDRLQARAYDEPLVPTGAWHDRCRLWKRELAVMNEPHARPDGRINYYDLNDVLGDLCGPGDTIVADGGSAFYVVGQAFRVKSEQRVLISGALGAMGHAVPVAIGAVVAAPERRAVVVTGEGCFQSSIQELATLAYNQLNVKMFVVNNNGYLSIRNTQQGYFNGFLVGTDSSCGVSFPPLEKVAATYDLPYLVARQLDELKAVVSQALATPGPVLCEIVTPPTQEIIPTVSSYKREDGTMESRPLHDMYPFMDPETLRRYML